MAENMKEMSPEDIENAIKEAEEKAVTDGTAGGAKPKKVKKPIT